MSEVQQWLYIDTTGQQVGPIAADQLHEYVSAGHITADTQVWTDGMEAWLPASQVEGLIPAAPAQHTPQINLGPQTTGAAAPAAQANPYASPAAGVPQEGGEYPIPGVNKISFGLYLTCLLGGLVLIFIGMYMIIASAPTADEVATNPDALKKSGSIALPIILSVLGSIAIIVSSIIQFIAIYRVWTILKPGGGTVSPGAAVGFLFIPVFGGIWIIILLCKLPGEWNAIVARYTNTAEAPRMSMGIAICAILIPVIGQILWMKEVSNGINFMASARYKVTNQQPATQGGGIVLR